MRGAAIAQAKLCAAFEQAEVHLLEDIDTRLERVETGAVAFTGCIKLIACIENTFGNALAQHALPPGYVDKTGIFILKAQVVLNNGLVGNNDDNDGTDKQQILIAKKLERIFSCIASRKH